MSVKKTVSETLCPISRAESVVGDRWTVLVPVSYTHLTLPTNREV